MSNIMSISHGLNVVSEDVPLVGQLIGKNGSHEMSDELKGFLPEIGRFPPYLKQLMAEVNPRTFSSLKIADVVERLGAVVSGEQDMVAALNQLKQDASFRIVGDMPIGPLMRLLGWNNAGDSSSITSEEIPITTHTIALSLSKIIGYLQARTHKVRAFFCSASSKHRYN